MDYIESDIKTVKNCKIVLRKCRYLEYDLFESEGFIYRISEQALYILKEKGCTELFRLNRLSKPFKTHYIRIATLRDRFIWLPTISQCLSLIESTDYLFLYLQLWSNKEEPDQKYAVGVGRKLQTYEDVFTGKTIIEAFLKATEFTLNNETI